MSQENNLNTKVPSAGQNSPSRLDLSKFINTDVRQYNTVAKFTDKHIKRLFITKFRAALTNRDTVLREIRACIRLNGEQRCKALSKQINAYWRNLSIKNGCILFDNIIAIPDANKKAVIELFYSTHPGSWRMTELAQQMWWHFATGRT